MTSRADFEELRLHLDRGAGKDTQSVVLDLSREYARLAPDERASVNELLMEWLLSDNETDRFDAQALIFDHRISCALPALELLASRLEKAAGPGAPYELGKVKRLIERLK